MIDPVGQQLGNYRLIRLLGQGGFADVYLGEHVHLRTQAAIKILQMRLAEEHAEAFINEARTIAHLIHPNIVRVLDFGVQNAVPFLVMDYAPGGTMRRHMPSGKPLPPADLFPFISQVASALQYAHNRKLIHRDIKPENMLIGVNGEVLLSDFGLALVTQSTRSRSTGGGAGDMSGTATYMAPEQAQGNPRPASDQYALGIIVYEWLTGSRPFQGTFLEVATQQVLAPTPSLRAKVPTISPAIEEIVMRAMAKDYQQRFPGVQDFAAALAQACVQEGLISAQAAQAAQAAMPASAAPGASSLGNISQLTYLPSATSQGSQPAPITPPPSVPSQFMTTPAPSQNYTTETIADPQASQMTFMKTPPTAQPMQWPANAAASPAPSSQAGWPQTPVPLTQSMPGGFANQSFMTPQSADNNSAEVVKALRQASHTNKLLLVVSVLLVCLLLGGGGMGWFFMRGNQHPGQVPPPGNKGSDKGTIVVQTPPTGGAATAQPVAATPTAPGTSGDIPNPYAASMGTLILNDPLASNQQKWDEGDPCNFTAGAYHVVVSQEQSAICYAHATNYADFTYEVQMTFANVGKEDHPTAAGGIVFRGNNDTGASYRAEMFEDGTISFLACKDANSCEVIDGSSQQPFSGFNTGPDQVNKLAVVAHGNLLDFYVNGQQIFRAAQANLSSQGMIGVYAQGGKRGNGAEIVFSNARVWQA